MPEMNGIHCALKLKNSFRFNVDKFIPTSDCLFNIHLLMCCDREMERWPMKEKKKKKRNRWTNANIEYIISRYVRQKSNREIL